MVNLLLHKLTFFNISLKMIFLNFQIYQEINFTWYFMHMSREYIMIIFHPNQKLKKYQRDRLLLAL